MDIVSRNPYPAGKLSNFTGFKFIFDEVECNSMEGLLQAFKFENIDSQKATCSLIGFSAKRRVLVEIHIGSKSKLYGGMVKHI